MNSIRMLSLALVLALGSVGTVSACSCLAPKSPEAAFHDTETLVEAQFLGDRKVWGSLPEGLPTTLGVFQVVRKWRGEPPSRIEAGRGPEGSSCFRTLTVGERYVLADRGGQFQVTLCSPFLEKASEVEDALGPGELVGVPEPEAEAP